MRGDGTTASPRAQTHLKAPLHLSGSLYHPNAAASKEEHDRFYAAQAQVAAVAPTQSPNLALAPPSKYMPSSSSSMPPSSLEIRRQIVSGVAGQSPADAANAAYAAAYAAHVAAHTAAQAAAQAATRLATNAVTADSNNTASAAPQALRHYEPQHSHMTALKNRDHFLPHETVTQSDIPAPKVRRGAGKQNEDHFGRHAVPIAGSGTDGVPLHEHGEGGIKTTFAPQAHEHHAEGIRTHIAPAPHAQHHAEGIRTHNAPAPHAPHAEGIRTGGRVGAESEPTTAAAVALPPRPPISQTKDDQSWLDYRPPGGAAGNPLKTVQVRGPERTQSTFPGVGAMG
jgi:hypothetical protein